MATVKDYWCRFKYPYNHAWHLVRATSEYNARRKMIKGSYFRLNEVVVSKSRPKGVPPGVQSCPIKGRLPNGGWSVIR